MAHGMPFLNSAHEFGSARYSCKEILPVHFVAACKQLLPRAYYPALLLLSQEASA